jgi:hypothetical protein
MEAGPLESVGVGALKDLIMGAFSRTFGDLVALSRAGAVIIVALLAAVKTILSWQAGGVSGLQAVAIIVTIAVYEVAAVISTREFRGLSFLVLLALPLAVWIGLQVILGTSARERRKTWIRDDMRRYMAALRRDPKNVAAHVLLGDSYAKLGKRAQAEREYRAALALDPTQYEARYKLKRVRAT